MYMDGWDIALLVGASYIAVITLARLMLHEHRQVLAQFRAELERESQQRKLLEKQKKKQAKAAAPPPQKKAA